MINGVILKYIDRFELDLINGYYCIHLYYSDAFNDAIWEYDKFVEMLYNFKFKGESCL